MKRDFLSLDDLSADEIRSVIRRAMEMKADRAAGRTHEPLAGRQIGMLFYKPSMRTRVSFEVGINELGGRAVLLTDAEIQLGRREPISHAARVLSRSLHGLVIRTYDQNDLVEMAREGAIPIINALTDRYHPCQVLADLMTVVQRRGSLDGLKAAWIGDGNNVCHSWLNAAGRLGFEIRVAAPEEYRPDPALSAAARKTTTVILTEDPVEAAAGADVINTDTWYSMGREDEAARRREIFEPYRVDDRLLDQAAPDAVVLHCLPAHLGEEITAEVLEGPRSAVFDQAENRLHAQKALMELIVGP
jgi:ornithine carbamoyltransferase